MATFTSVTSGNWNDGATWGKTSPGVKGTDWPGITGDVVNIGTTANQSHVVTYNVSETNELGQITIGATSGTGAARLEFSRSMNTKLTLGSQEILCQLTGELRVGASGLIIPKQYTAEIVWDTAADNSKGINVANGGKVNIYGDPDYYGSLPYSTLYQNFTSVAQGTTGVNIYVNDNVSSKWLNGHQLVVHFGQLYSSSQDYNKSFLLFTLTADATWDGTKSTLTGTITSYTGTVGTTFATGGMVVNVSRNVKLYKFNYSNAIGNNNTGRPRVTDANANINFVCSNAQFSGWYTVHNKSATFLQTVIRNGYYGLYSGIGSTFTGAMYSVSNAVYMGQGVTIDSDGLIFNMSNISNYGTNNIFNGLGYGVQYGLSDTFSLCNGSIFSSLLAILGNYQTLGPSGCLYWNITAIDAGGTLIKGSLSYDATGNQKANTTDIALGKTTLTNLRANGGYQMINAKVISTGPTFGTSRNQLFFKGRLSCEHYQQVANAHYVFDGFGDVAKVNAGATGTPPSGAANYLKMLNPQSNLGTSNWLEIIPRNTFRVWQKAGTVVYKIYVQAPTGNNFNYAAADLVLYADYISAASPLALATANSTGSVSKADNWGQYLSVSVTSAADGYVTLYLRLMNYYAAADVLYVDSGIWAGGNLLMGDWNYGEMVYPGPSNFGGGSNPSLYPLGVMEVVN